MKVLHVIHSLDLRSGGPSHAIRGMAHAQAEAGHAVTVLATTTQSAEPWDSDADFAARIRGDAGFGGVDVVLQKAYGKRRPFNRLGFCPSARRWLADRCRDSTRRPDVIHIHGVFSHLTSLAAAAARRAGIPYFVRPTGALDEVCFQQGSRFLKRAFAWLVLHRDLQHAAFVHATSEAEAESLKSWAEPDRIRVIPLGVELASPLEPGSANPIAARVPGLQGRQVVLFLSRVAPKKRLELLVAALADLRREWPELVLAVAGQDAGGMAAVEAEVRRHGMGEAVFQLGFVAGEDKRAAYSLASVFALPSLDENFGVSVIEALSYGVPVLVTKGVASHVHVDASGAGLTVGDSVQSIADGLRQLLQADRQALGTLGRQYVAEHLTWPAVVKEVDLLYEQAILRAASSRVLVP